MRDNLVFSLNGLACSWPKPNLVPRFHTDDGGLVRRIRGNAKINRKSTSELLKS